MIATALKHRQPGHAFALVVVLVVLSLLAVVAVGYLSSMTSERATANAFGNKTRAEQAAQAGVDSAMGVLSDYIKAFPDSATVWDPNQTTNVDGTPSGGTTLYLRAVPATSASPSSDIAPDPLPGVAADPTTYGNANYAGGNNPNNVSAAGVDQRKTFVLPLVSGATVRTLELKSTALPTPTADTFVNLNSRRQIGDTQGWLGTPPVYTSSNGLPKPVSVPWVEIKQRQDPANAGKTLDPANAPVVGRYAYWIEDESFRANISYANQNITPSGPRRDNTTNAALNPGDLSLLGLLNFIADPSAATTAQNLLTTRSYFPNKLFPESGTFTHTDGLDTSVADKLRYLTTSQSAALNLTRHGTQRLNLNTLIDPAVLATDTNAVQKQIDKIVRTVQFHAPNFGQRFYRNKWSNVPPAVPTDLNALDVSAPHSLIYMYKIAANLRDYIDTDALPTVVEAGVDEQGKPTGKVRPPGRPIKAINFNDGPNPAWAIGKDSAPLMQEAAVRFTPGTAGSGMYSVNVDYYIEFWNMSTRDIKSSDLGSHPFIRVLNPPKWFADNKSNPTGTMMSLQDGSGHTLTDTRDVSPPGRDFDIDLSQSVTATGTPVGPITFPAGAVTVITTDVKYTDAIAGSTTPNLPSIADVNTANRAEAATHYVLCGFISPGKRTFTGTMPTGCNEVRMLYGATTSSDYETAVVVGNDNGYIDALEGAIPMTGGVVSIPYGSSPRAVYGGYLRGNLASGTATGGLQPSELGDPRTNNEQLTYTLHVSSGNTTDQTLYKNFDLTSTSNQIPPTFGLPNIYSVAPARPANPWPDYYWFPGSGSSPGSSATAVMKATNAPAIVANVPLLSIGQLGDIFDPARLPYTNSGDVLATRGGGRTYKIGQHDDLYDGVLNSPSNTWASWRLTDLFTTTDTIDQPGLININGLARDNGAALYTAFQGFKFQPQTSDGGTAANDSPIHGDAKLDGKTFDAALLKPLIDDIIGKRLTNTDITKPGPFFERGEISETPFLNPTATTVGTLATNVTVKDVFDSGREELVRRLIEMTTTRGSVFTVYALGQSITQSSNLNGVKTKRVAGTYQMRVTFKLTPKDSNGKDFQPTRDPKGAPIDFNPNVVSELNLRFSKPDHYDIKVLSASSGTGSG